METAQYIERISVLFKKNMLDPLEERALAAGNVELTHAQFQGLVYLLRHGRRSIGEMAEGLCISHPAAVKMVDRLQRKKLVSRDEGDQDRRVSYVALTPQGRRLVETGLSERLTALASATEQMEREELEGLIRGLEALLAGVLNNRQAVEDACLHCGTSHIGCCPVNRAHAALTGTAIDRT